MTPKSLLRHPKAVSSLSDFTDLKFQTVISDPKTPTMNAQRVIFCSGKVYYDLLAARDRLQRDGDSVLIHRIEQLYPLDEDLDIAPTLSTLPEGAEVTWVQEEPLNQGVWPHWRLCFGEYIAGHPLRGVGRPASASPATGSAASHRIEQESLLRSAFGHDPE